MSFPIKFPRATLYSGPDFRSDHIYIADSLDGNGQMCLFIELHAPALDPKDTYGDSVIVYQAKNDYVPKSGPQEWGSYASSILIDYTHMLAARRILAYWKRWQERRRERSARVIQTAWQNWLVKKNERFNPYTIVGIVDMFLTFRRLVGSIDVA